MQYLPRRRLVSARSLPQPAAGASPPLHISNQPDADGRRKVFPWEILSPGNCGRMGTRFYIWVFLGNFATLGNCTNMDKRFSQSNSFIRTLCKERQKSFARKILSTGNYTKMGTMFVSQKSFHQDTIQRWAQGFLRDFFHRDTTTVTMRQGEHQDVEAQCV